MSSDGAPDAEQRYSLLRDALEPMSGRELRHGGLLAERGGGPTKLTDWAEVGGRGGADQE